MALSIGKSRAKVFMEKNTGVTFADVAGVDEAKASWSRSSIPQESAGVWTARGAHPEGRVAGRPARHRQDPAGQGCCRARRRCRSFHLRIGVCRDVRRRAARARPVRAGARQAPAIIFIDELDAGSRAASAGPIGGHDEREQTLNQLLTEMDGLTASVGLIIPPPPTAPKSSIRFAARRSLRPSGAGGPARQEGTAGHPEGPRQEGDPGQDIDLEQVAALTTGFSGADLANLVTRPRWSRPGAKRPPWSCRISPPPSSASWRAWRRRTECSIPRSGNRGHHEMGHALVALALPGTDPVTRSIIPRGIGAPGYTLQRPTEDRFLMTRRSGHPLGMAEKLVFGELSTGAGDDLASHRHRPRHDHPLWHGRRMGYIAFEAQRPRFLDTPELAHGGCRVAESTQARIDQAIRDIVMGVFERAYRILDTNRAVLDGTAGAGNARRKRYPSIDPS